MRIRSCVNSLSNGDVKGHALTEVNELPVSDSDGSSDYDTDLEQDEEAIAQQDTERQKSRKEADAGIGLITYEDMCRISGLVPVRKLMEQLQGRCLCLQHVGLNDEHCKALACALWHNTCITCLDLEDAGMSRDGLVSVIHVTRNSENITSLSLSENSLDSVSCLALHDLLRDTTCLTHLNLAGTRLGEREIEHVATGLQLNNTVRWLNISHNEISVEGGKKLGTVIGSTTTLESLDASWNHIRLAGAVGLLKGLKINRSLVYLNLAMNGLGFEGSLQLEETLQENGHLRFLDVSNNRINWEGVTFVAKGLKKNTALHMIKIGSNPINMEGCYELLKAVSSRRSCVLHVGLENIPVNGAVLTVATEIRKCRQFSMIHGGILDTRDVVGIRREKPEDPITLVVRYLAAVGIRIIDLFRMFDLDNDGHVTRREFIRGLKKLGVPLPEKVLINVASRLDKYKKGYINYGILMSGVRNHIRTERKEMTREKIRTRNRLEERRRILQTELPDIFKRTYDDDLLTIYTTKSTNSLIGSLTSSFASFPGRKMSVLPPIDSAISKRPNQSCSNTSTASIEMPDEKKTRNTPISLSGEERAKLY